jgi:hypothetical protein
MTKTKDPLADEFLPKDYELPASNSFMKFIVGKNKFRILSSLTTGYEYWTTEDKPVRSKVEFTETPNIKTDPKTGKQSVNHFWAVVVYNYATEAIQILEITQKGIQKYILGLVNDPDWGKPQGYDLVVNKEGEGFATKYTVAANPHKAMPADILEEYEKSGITAESLFEE